LQRPADGREVPALRWSDLSQPESPSDGAFGLSLLNDCKYGHQAQGNTMGLTLVRASYEPDNNPDEGQHQFTYSLYPHDGDWKQAGTIRRAAELNQPVSVAVTHSHPGMLQPGQPWLRTGAENALISAVKPAEDQPAKGQALIVRVYEAHGKAVQTALLPAWPVERAEEVNPVEESVGELAVNAGAIPLTLNPHEIKTIKLYMK
jgi:alpha-mannosidase